MEGKVGEKGKVLVLNGWLVAAVDSRGSVINFAPFLGPDSVVMVMGLS